LVGSDRAFVVGITVPRM